MTADIVKRVLRSSRYRDVDHALLSRLASEELPRARNTDDAVKRVKRRLHQAVGAFRGESRGNTIAEAWNGDMADPAFRAACADALRAHASTRERLPHLDAFFAGIWRHTGRPSRVLDLGCGFGPLALPWMGIGQAEYVAMDVDSRLLGSVEVFLSMVGQPHRVESRDLVTAPPPADADVALLLKLITTLDRQDPDAGARLLGSLRVGHAVVSFPARSLSGHRKGMKRSYRDRLERLVADTGRVSAVAEASVPNELVFVLTLDSLDG